MQISETDNNLNKLSSEFGELNAKKKERLIFRQFQI